MDIRTHLKKTPNYVLFSFLGLWILVYVTSRFFLIMSSDRGGVDYWLWIACASIPFSAFAAWRTAQGKTKKWLTFVGHTLLYSIVAVFGTGYIIVNGDILISSALKPKRTVVAEIVDVHKVFGRKTGFDHTSVTVLVKGQKITMEARPFAYFYLRGKSSVQLTLGRSMLGNDFVTSIDVDSRQKIKARWAHFTDMLYRLRLLWALLGCVILGVWLVPGSFLKNNSFKKKPLSAGKQIGIVVIILIGLGTLFYIGVLLYMFFLKGN